MWPKELKKGLFGILVLLGIVLFFFPGLLKPLPRLLEEGSLGHGAVGLAAAPSEEVKDFCWFGRNPGFWPGFLFGIFVGFVGLDFD